MKDCKQGYGVLDGESGGRYEGTWHDNHRDGYGMEVYKDGGNSNNMDFCLKKWFQYYSTPIFDSSIDFRKNIH